MGGTKRYNREEAMVVAREIFPALQEASEPKRFLFAGSLRRLSESIGDIEMVYIPKIEQRPDPGDLLGNPIPVNLVDLVLDEWLKTGKISKRTGPEGGTAWGPKNKLAVHTASGIPLDFFATEESCFYSLLVCRTGPKEFNTKVCCRAIELFEKWNPYRGFEDRMTGDLRFQPRSEEELFSHLGWNYLEASKRNLTPTRMAVGSRKT
jgi:DNA polymerase/3'-5' exonuclease PolX